MNQWLVVLGGILAFVLLFLLFGFVFFLVLRRLDKKIKPEIARIGQLQDERQETILSAFDLLEARGLDDRVDLSQFHINPEDDLLVQRDKQQFALMIIRKVIDEEKEPDSELVEMWSKVVQIEENSELAYKTYNRKVRTFNALYSLIFVRPFTAFSKLKSYPYLR